jgi:hypothetical protein
MRSQKAIPISVRKDGREAVATTNYQRLLNDLVPCDIRAKAIGASAFFLVRDGHGLMMGG